MITLDQARAQVRVESDYPADQLQPAIDGAVDAAQAYLNRQVYADAAALSAARGAHLAAVSAAVAGYSSALAVAESIEGEIERAAAVRLADAVYREAVTDAVRCVHGIVVNASIRSAILLTIGHLFANRSAVAVGDSATEIPMGAQALLRPYRRVMMP